MSDQATTSFIGQEVLVERLFAQAEAGQLHHALLLLGGASLGKATFARQLLARVLGVSVEQLAQHPDAVLVEPTPHPKTGKMREQIAADQVQEARHRFEQSPLHGGAKVLLVDGADRLSATAANALLKTLEEPRGNAYIVLTAVQETAVLATIRSRAHSYRLQPVATDMLAQALEVRGAAAEDARQFAIRSAGAPGKALRWMQDTEARQEMETLAAIAERCLSSSTAERILAARGLLPKDAPDHATSRNQFRERLTYVELALRDSYLAQHGCADLAAAAPSSINAPTTAMRSIAALRRSIDQHIHPRVALIHAMMSFH